MFEANPTIRRLSNESITGDTLTFNGVLNCNNFKQAEVRSDPKLKNKGGEAVLAAFTSIFFLGLLSRGASIPYLIRQSEPPAGAWKHAPVPLRTLLIRPLMGQERPLLLFMLVFQLALQISSCTRKIITRAVASCCWSAAVVGCSTIFVV